jgi:hypothetical protein
MELDEDGEKYAEEDYNIPPEFDVDAFYQDITETYKRHGAYLYVTKDGVLKVLEYDVDRPEFTQLDIAVFAYKEKNPQ